MVFTGKYFSLMFLTGDNPRPATRPDPTKASAAELEAINRPLVAASGTYEITGQTLTTHPMVAKLPWVMAPNVTIVYTLKLDGKTLTLTQIKGENGPIANPLTLKFSRVD
jgi:hypothetical protein